MSPKATLTASVIGLGPKVSNLSPAFMTEATSTSASNSNRSCASTAGCHQEKFARALLEYAQEKDERIYEEHRIDDKTVFVIKRTRVAEQQAAVSLFP